MSATVTQVLTRLRELLAAIPGLTTVLDGSETSINAASLPAVLVTAGAARRRRLSGGTVEITREFEIFLFVSEINQSDKPDVVAAAIADASDWLDTVPDLFLQHRRLHSADAGIVFDTNDLPDSGPVLTPYLGKSYAAIRYPLPVITIHHIS
jgi:hypothetical protein